MKRFSNRIAQVGALILTLWSTPAHSDEFVTRGPHESLSQFVQRILPAQTELAHPAFEGAFGPSKKSIGILFRLIDSVNTNYTSWVLIPENDDPGSYKKYVLPPMDEAPGAFDIAVTAALYAQADKDPAPDLIVMYRYYRNGSVTDSGYAANVYHWNGTTFLSLDDVARKLVGLKTTAEIRRKLRSRDTNDGTPLMTMSSHEFEGISDDVFQPGREPLDCGEAPVITFPSGAKMAVCERHVSPLPGTPNAYLVEQGDPFTLAVKTNRGSLERLVEAGGFGENPYVLRLGPRDRVVLEERFYDHYKGVSQYYPLFSRTITCGSSCTVGPERCVAHFPSTLYAGVVQQVRQEKRKTFASLPGEAYTTMVADYGHRLLGRALAGDAEAARMLLNFPFELDAAPGEIVSSDEEIYRKAVRLHCPGLAAKPTGR